VTVLFHSGHCTTSVSTAHTVSAGASILTLVEYCTKGSGWIDHEDEVAAFDLGDFADG
jgi:hypothetical protein